MSWKSAWFGVAATTLVFALSRAERLTAEPSTGGPSAAELIRGVVEAESRIHQFPALRIWMETTVKVSPERMAEAKAESGREVRPEASWTDDVVFDSTRFRQRSEMTDLFGDTRESLCTWDGETRKDFTVNVTGGVRSEQYLLGSSVQWGLGGLLLHAFELEPRRFWWSQFDPVRRVVAQPEDYVLSGEELFRGRACYRLDCPRAMRQVFIGVADRRLYGFATHSSPSDVEELALQSRVAAKQFATLAAARESQAELSESDRRRFRERCDRARFEAGQPGEPTYLDDYREFAPGLWLPTKSESGGVVRKIVELQIDPPRTAELFDVKIPNGATVLDTRQGLWPPLAYGYKTSFTEAEWQAIIAPRANELAEQRRDEAALLERVGQIVPEIPPGLWLGGEPQALTNLRGKMVLLEFTSYSCGPCMRHIPALAELHRESRDAGLAVIAIHQADEDTPRIKQYVADNAIEYPLYVDGPARDPKFWGRTFEWFGFEAVPRSVLIDAEGKVAACGDLEDVLIVAHKLALPKP